MQHDSEKQRLILIGDDAISNAIGERKCASVAALYERRPIGEYVPEFRRS